MSAPTPRPPLAIRLVVGWLRLLAYLVPARDRAAWREEWQGELLLAKRRGPLHIRRLLDLSSGLLRDALDVRRAGVRPRGIASGDPPGSRWTPARWLDAALRNLRHAVRRLRHAPVFSLGVAATLALGIGANTAIFVVADTVLLKPLPYADAERLYMIWESGPQATAERTHVSVPDYLDWRARETGFEEMAAYSDAGFNVTLASGRAIRVEGQVVSSSFFPLLGVAPQLGRGFLPEEDEEGRGLTAVLSHGFWEQEMGGDSGAIGSSLSVDGATYTIVGVMPAAFRFPGDAALWLPLGTYGGNLRVWRATHILGVVGRLGPDADSAAAASRMTRLAQELWGHGQIWNGWTITVRPLRDEIHGDVRQAAGFVWSAGLSLLLVMCANLANLFLAAGVHRRAELALRRALGAGRRVLLGQAAMEIVVLVAPAVALGLGLAVVLLRGVAARLPEAVRAVHAPAVDLRSVAYAVALAGGSAVLFGILPAARRPGSEVAWRLREGGRSASVNSAGALRETLVGGQIALSFALLVTALLMADSYRRLRGVDPGFRSDAVTSFRVALAGAEYAAPEARRAFFQQVEGQLAGIPGVGTVGTGSHVPFVPTGRGAGASVWATDRVRDADMEQPLAQVLRVSPGLLPTIGVDVTRGRPLRDADDSRSVPVALVNHTAAAMLWPGADPVGARIHTGVTGDAEILVIGIAEDVQLTDLREPASPQVFVAAAQFPPASQTFVLRAERAVDPDLLRGAVAAVDPTQPIYDVAALDAYVDRSLAASILSTRVLGALAILAVTLAAVGVYAVVAFTVGSRTREFSVRRAVGARSGDVLALVLREGAFVVGLGLAAGSLVAAAAARLLSSRLFGVSALDPSAYLIAAALLGLLALASILAPALVAVRVHPARALR